MTLFLACVFALLAAVFGFATWMYYGAVEAMLSEIEVLDGENTMLTEALSAQYDEARWVIEAFASDNKSLNEQIEFLEGIIAKRVEQLEALTPAITVH